MNNKVTRAEILEQLSRIEVLEKMLNENIRKFNENELYIKNFNSTKTSLLSQIVILRNELLVLSKQIKEAY